MSFKSFKPLDDVIWEPQTKPPSVRIRGSRLLGSVLKRNCEPSAVQTNAILHVVIFRHDFFAPEMILVMQLQALMFSDPPPCSLWNIGGVRLGRWRGLVIVQGTLCLSVRFTHQRASHRCILTHAEAEKT